MNIDIASGAESKVADLGALLPGPSPLCCLKLGRRFAGRSPDGRYILGIQDREPVTALFALDTLTGRVRKVFESPYRDALNHYGDLPWMPDSQAVVANVRGPRADEQTIWWIPVDGREPRKFNLRIPGLADSAIAVHPDGKHIAVVAGHWVPLSLGLTPDPGLTGSPIEYRILTNIVAERAH
jgi:hypothetical protein